MKDKWIKEIGKDYLRFSVESPGATLTDFNKIFSSLEELAISIKQNKLCGDPNIVINDNKCHIYPRVGKSEFIFGKNYIPELGEDDYKNSYVKIEKDSYEFYFYSSEPDYSWERKK